MPAWTPRSVRSLAVGLAVLVTVLAVVVLQQAPAARSRQPFLGALGPEGVPVPTGRVLAGPGPAAPGIQVDGIPCGPIEEVAFHVHAHLTIFVSGSPRAIPAGVGIAAPRRVAATESGPFVAGGTCFSWLHTHAADGIIHIESPVERSYTLGDFFDVWREPLGPHRLGPTTGRVTAFLDGRRYEGDPREIPLAAHVQIQLDLGTPIVAPEPIRFPPGL
jgi:hypothetical protein